MSIAFRRVSGDRERVIAMVHLAALPGAPLHDAADGIDAVMFGNENDRPHEFEVDRASTAIMAATIGRLRDHITVPWGANLARRRGEAPARLGPGPGMNLHGFHGRGTLNGVIAHPTMARMAEAAAAGMPLQRSAQVGVLADLGHVHLVGEGVAAVAPGFPMRYSHSAVETVDLADLAALSDLLAAFVAAVRAGIGPETDLAR